MIGVINLEKKRKLSARKRNDYFWGYLMIAPLMLGIAVFYIYPIFRSIWMSFYEVGAFNKMKWEGMGNYLRLFQDDLFYNSFWNTLKYVIMTVPVGIFLAIFLATLLNNKISGVSFYRTIYFLPSVTMAAAVAMVWKWLYNGDFGLINSLLAKVGIQGTSWLTNNSTALASIAIVGIWSMVGYNMIILLAGMQGISKNYYEAAAIDGAGPFRQFFSITVPLLSPTIFFIMITSLIRGFQVFDTIFMMVKKTSPAFESTQTLVMMFYRHAFDYSEKGYASAIGNIIFVIIMLITAVQMVLQKRWVHYD